MHSDPNPFTFTGPAGGSSPEARVYRNRERHAAFSLRGAEVIRRASPRPRVAGPGYAKGGTR